MVYKIINLKEYDITNITYDLCLEAIKSDVYNIKYVPINLITKELTEIAVNINGLILNHIPNEFKTLDICKLAVNIHGGSLGYVPFYKFNDDTNYEICKIAVQNYSHAFYRVPEKYITKEIIENLIKKDKVNIIMICGNNLDKFDQIFINNIIKECISYRNSLLDCIPKKYITNEIATIALNNCQDRHIVDVFKCLSKEILLQLDPKLF